MPHMIRSSPEAEGDDTRAGEPGPAPRTTTGHGEPPIQSSPTGDMFTGPERNHAEPPLPSTKDGWRRLIRAGRHEGEVRRDHSLRACERLQALDVASDARTIMLYLSLPDEVDTHPLARWCISSGRTCCVPVVDWDHATMAPSRVDRLDEDAFVTGPHGVRVPRAPAPVSPAALDLVVVPGLAFDEQGWRLGQGGGHYDRFLSELPETCATIGLSFDDRVVTSLPHETHDVPMDLVVTEARVLTGAGLIPPPRV